MRRSDVRRIHPPRGVPALVILLSAIWGIVVDKNIVPILTPTGNSTIVQATTAAAFALIGILIGPLAGGLAGLLRDGTAYVATLIYNPQIVTEPGFPQWIGHGIVDTLEDVVLGLVPGLVALRTRSIVALAFTSAATAWLSLPFLLIADALIDGRPDLVGHVLTTHRPDWDAPVDGGLLVYAVVTGAFVALALAGLATRPRTALLVAALYGAAACLLIALGAPV